MSARRQICYIGGYIDPGFDRAIEACADLSLIRVDKSKPFSALHSTLAASHAIQIDSARLDIPEHLRVGREFLAQCPNVLVVSASGAGFDAIDVAACSEAGVIAVNQTGGNREAVGEHTLGMMLSLTKRIGETDRALRSGEVVDRIAYMGDDLYGKTVGIVGFGNTGTRVAELCGGLFAMTVLACDPYVGANAITARGARKVELPELLQVSDFVSLHCPLTAETARMIGALEYAQMKKGAFFLTAARGGIHDEAALYEALTSGHLAGAGVDVWEQEPPPSDHPLLTLSNVIASPHTAGVTHAARRKLASMAAEQLIDVLRGGTPQRMLNAEALPASVNGLYRCSAMRDTTRNPAAIEPPLLSRHLQDILSLEDLEPAAERYLPHCIFSFISGAVETNTSRHENRAAFQDYDFHPRVLVDVSARTTAKALFDETFSAPFGIAPMGGSGLAGYRADLTLAAAAAAENVPFILSGASLVRMEEVAQANPRTWFQAYLPVERDAIGALIDRVKAAGYRHLVVTADVPVGGNRENLVRAGYTSPLRPTVKLALDAAAHPRWLFGNALRTLRQYGMPYYENSSAERGMAVFSSAATRAHMRDSLSWRDLEWIRERWQGKLIVKGILAPADAETARKIGCDGVIVSNHGGRQLDGAAAPLRALPRIAEVAQGMAVLLDSGIRRGTDVIKALALGADFVFVGRPFLYAAAIGQEAGVRRAIDLLRSEVHRNLAFLGSRDVSDLDGRVVRRIDR